MKKLMTLICFAYILFSYQTVLAQESNSTLEESLSFFKKSSPIYNYSERPLNNTDTIPDFDKNKEKLMITGTIFQNDGKTPANGVLLSISQTDANGEYKMEIHNEKRYIHHRGWIKTGSDGHYTFYTFVPGTYHHSNELKLINPVIKVPGKSEYAMTAMVFDNDPLLSKYCRSKLKRNGINSILKLKKEGDLYVATKDIVLDENNPQYQ
ncbi:dioxygenase family protein [Yeosuana sp.]|uniref:dioxygenase family protein n=1 Tax=Yeosuana sp. TaxID=2529388 RepID=UPI004054FD4B|tara:strand:- start:236 stop:862 length:627 start_codon:yes stop_codon:yes gene_type:complete